MITLIAGTEAKRLSRKWRIDSEDISQEILLYAIKRNFNDDIEKLNDVDDDEEYSQEVRKIRSSLKWAGERYCRKEKASIEGYNPQDEAFYSLGYLEELLSVYYQVGVTEHAPVGVADSVRHTKSDGAEYGNYLATVMDLEKGLKNMSARLSERLYVRLALLGHLSDDKVATLSQSEAWTLTSMHPDTLRELMGATGDAVRHRTKTALAALQREMGGPSPYREVA